MVSSIPSQISAGMVGACGITIWAWLAQVITERVDVKARFLLLPIPLKTIPYLACAGLVFILNSETPKAFIYFKF
jgi:hypothetical protein